MGKLQLDQTSTIFFEEIEPEHLPQIKTMFVTNSLNYPGEGITLRQNRSTNNSSFSEAKVMKTICHELAQLPRYRDYSRR